MSDLITNFDLDKIQDFEEMRAIAKQLKAQLEELRLHSVYGFWTKAGRLFYAGQSNDFCCRLAYHFAKLNKEMTAPFYKMLASELKQGVYVSEIFTGLTELEANDLENCLIKWIKRDPQTAGNTNDGRWTEKFTSMSQEDRQVQIDLAYERSVQVFVEIDKSLLFTDKNYNAMLKRDEFKTFKTGKSPGQLNEGICGRCENWRILYSGKYCKSCYNLLGKYKKAGTTAPAFDQKKVRKGSNYSNQTERSLCYIMKKQEPSLSQNAVTGNICNLTGEKSVARSSISDWHGKFSGEGFNSKDFVLLKSGTNRGLSGFSEKTIQALVVYLHGQQKNAEQTVQILNSHFEDAHEFSLAEVEAIRAEIVEVKKNLKRKADKGDQETPSKQPKLKI